MQSRDLVPLADKNIEASLIVLLTVNSSEKSRRGTGENLVAELAQLHEWQLETLKTAAFIPMSQDEWGLFEARLSRIQEISVLLAP